MWRGVLAALALVITPLGAPATAAAAGPHYVALGDSAAAGPVLLPQEPTSPGACTRSQVNFPGLTATALGAASYVDATCSSATTADLYASQGAGIAPQLDALGADTTLVTLGPIGANDVGVVDTVVSCLVPGCRERDGSKSYDAIRALAPELVRAVRAVHTRAPNAAVLVVGYGRYLPPGGCPGTQPLSASDSDYVQSLVDLIDDELATAATANGATFVDLRTAPGALDHTACAAGGQRWLEGLVPLSGDGAIPFHPTAIGMKAFAGLVTATARTALAAAPTTTGAAPKLRAHCRDGRLVLRVGPAYGITQVRFAVGHRRLGTDRKPAFRAVSEQAVHGRAKAVVELTTGQRVRLSRHTPRC